MQKTGVIAGSYHHRNALAGVRNIGGFIYHRLCWRPPCSRSPVRAYTLPRDDITESAYTVLIRSANFECGDDELEDEAVNPIRGECEPSCGCTPLLVDSFCRHVLGVRDRLARGSWRKSSDPAALDLHR